MEGAYQTKDVKMRAYRNLVLDMLEKFQAHTFSIKTRDQKSIVDSLAVSASLFIIPTHSSEKYEVEVRHRPVIPDNIINWQVFEDDQQVRNFIELKEEFQSTQMDQQNMFMESKEKLEVLQLKNNLIPKGLIPLEKLFDQNDVYKAPKLQADEEEVESCNLGDSLVPKMVKISKFLSADMKTKYVEMMKRFIDVFAWSYADLKQYDSSIIQHTIPIKENEKPFKQKLRRINPILMPLIEKEVKKLFDAKIIVPISFSNWLANLVPVRKKNGEIRICIDFENLNKASLKDNYPLPKMDLILQNIVGSQRMSMLDGFSGYNQILVHLDDQEKTAFTTPWGTFMYAKMPFGLMNAGATFQRAMDISFAEEKDKSVVVYLDDITVFSKREEDHLKHLERILLKCRRFGISLNPTKSVFALTSGKLLGHIIFEGGIRIDPNRVSAIQKLDLLRSRKEIQSFLGKVNFVRRFIPNFAEVVKSITNMLK